MNDKFENYIKLFFDVKYKDELLYFVELCYVRKMYRKSN